MTLMRPLLLLALAGPIALTWTSGEPLPHGVDHHATFVTTGSAGSILHAIAGNNYPEQFRTHYSAAIRGDGSLAPWHEEAPFREIILGHTVLVVEGTGVSVAGQTSGRHNIADVFTAPVARDGSVGAWSPAPPIPAPRFHAAAVASGPWIYVLGGLETTNATSTIFRSRVSGGHVGAWETLDALPRAPAHEAAFVYDGRLWLVAGLDGNPAGSNAPLNDIISARIGKDGRLGPWAAAGLLDSAYATHGAFVHDGWLYVAGGVENNRRFVDTVQ